MNEETYNLLYKILSDRIRFWRDKNPAAASSYESARIMLGYARDNDVEGLSQFDYYGEG